ncbi:MAG: ATP synthase F1 subunit delta [Deltaproteobacteria bacterium]|nr:ATP synthase F1 subunit delta [Deltaproteobacteria bacterium]
MKSSTVARRFAKALIEIGIEEKAYENYGKELNTALVIFSSHPELYKTLINPMYKIEARRGLMEQISASNKFSAHVAKFLNLLVETRSIRLLENIVDAYSRLEDELAGRVRATIESPAELGASLIEEIKTKISSATGKEVVISHQVNAGLLGGLVIRIDNTILDGSLKTQLNLMKEKILEGVV